MMTDYNISALEVESDDADSVQVSVPKRGALALARLLIEAGS